MCRELSAERMDAKADAGAILGQRIVRQCPEMESQKFRQVRENQNSIPEIHFVNNSK